MPPDPGPDAKRMRQRRASSFGAVAAAYAEHRPGYAAGAVDWVLAPVHDRRPVRVVDLGAGTGKLTPPTMRAPSGSRASTTPAMGSPTSR